MADLVATTSRNLTLILDLCTALPARAIDLGNSPLMPGGDAMIELGPVARSDHWLRRQHLDETHGIKHDHATDADPDQHWTAYQLLRYWSELWRIERDADYPDLRPTIETEAKWLRANIDSLRADPHFEDFARDVTTAKTKLENRTRSGKRPAFTGIPCVDPACDGARLQRWTEPAADAAGNKIWRLSDWRCPRCRLTWDEDAYARLEASHRRSAEHRGHFLNLDGQVWVSVIKAAEIIGQPRPTVWKWITTNQIPHREVRRRHTYVALTELRERETLRRQRSDAAKARIAAQQTNTTERIGA
jgi:hypothetical protein